MLTAGKVRLWCAPRPQKPGDGEIAVRRLTGASSGPTSGSARLRSSSYVPASSRSGWVSLPLWADLKEWQTAIYTVASVLTLFLVVLLENASRRTEEASQKKLNVIATALAELMASEAPNDGNVQDAAKRLREAVGLEERH